MKNMKNIMLFEQFVQSNGISTEKGKKYGHKLVSETQEDLVKGIKWFVGMDEITHGFVVPVDENGIKIEDRKNAVIKKTTNGYETEIGLFGNSSISKWNLDMIHSFMKKDNIDCKIVEYPVVGEFLGHETLKESETYGTSKQPPPSWTVGGVTIKIADVMKYLDKNNIPVTEIPVKDVFSKCAHKDKTDKETLDRSERSDLKFPIIVLKKNGKYHMVLDGHHRLLKAKNNNIDKIKARVFNLEDAPDEYKKVLY